METTETKAEGGKREVKTSGSIFYLRHFDDVRNVQVRRHRWQALPNQVGLVRLLPEGDEGHKNQYECDR